MFNEIKEVLKALESDTELFDITARLYYNLYERLVKAGFSEDQAIKIICSQNILNSSKKN